MKFVRTMRRHRESGFKPKKWRIITQKSDRKIKNNIKVEAVKKYFKN